MNKKHALLFLLILVIGIFFRFYLIGHFPGGLFPDEAAEGLDAQNILEGQIQPFYERGNGREGLYYYMIAPVIAIFGSGVWQLHVISAFAGVLTLIGTYLFTKRLYDKNIALVATFLLSVSAWHIVLSRTAFRAILIPMFVAFGFYFLVRVIQAQSNKERYWSAAFAGAFLAGGFYTYIAYRIVLGILAIIALLLLITDAKQKFIWVKQYFKSAIVALISFLIVFAPLGYYFYSHPGSFVGRSGQVSVFNPELNKGDLLGTFTDITVTSIKAYFTEGDLNWRHNVSGEPFLHFLISPFFGIALVIMTIIAAVYMIRTIFGRPNLNHLKHLVVIGLFWGLLVPAVTTAEGIPHGLRSIGTIPAVFIITAVGLVYFARKVLTVWHYEWMGRLYKFVAVLFFATLTFVTYTQYFVVAYNSPENNFAFRSDLTSVSKYLNEHPNKFSNYLILDLFSEQTPEYLTNQTRPYVVVDPAHAYKLNVGPDDRIIFTGSTMPDRFKFQETHKVKIEEIVPSKFDTFDMVVLSPQEQAESKSLSINSDQSFWALNLGDRIYWSWLNQSWDPWLIKIWQCEDASCENSILLKENNQNDYIQNSDYILIDGTEKDLYFKAQGFDANGNLIKDFGILKVSQYK